MSEWDVRVLDIQEGVEGDHAPVCLGGRGAAPPELRLHAIGALLGQGPNNLLERCEEYAALASGIYLQLLPRFFRHPRNALLLLLEHFPCLLPRKTRV